MLIIACYDVSTESAAGRRRLRRVAKRCERVGQRVQKSVFECRLSKELFEELERDLLKEIDISADCLRFYRITEPVEVHVQEHGVFRAVDFDRDALVV